jgi:hypothetical protein
MKNRPERKRLIVLLFLFIFFDEKSASQRKYNRKLYHDFKEEICLR